jgi:hypothetical protein
MDDIPRQRIKVDERCDRGDAELDSLSGANQPPGEDRRPTAGIRRAPPGEIDSSAVRHHLDLRRVHIVAREQPGSRGEALHDDGLGLVGEFFDDRALVERRRAQDGVEHRDSRSLDGTDEVDDLASVLPAVDTELMLDDRDVVALEDVRRNVQRPARTAHQLSNHLRSEVSARPLDGGDHTRLRYSHRFAQRSHERGDPTAGRGIRSNQRDRNRDAVTPRSGSPRRAPRCLCAG